MRQQLRGNRPRKVMVALDILLPHCSARARAERPLDPNTATAGLLYAADSVAPHATTRGPSPARLLPERGHPIRAALGRNRCLKLSGQLPARQPAAP